MKVKKKRIQVLKEDKKSVVIKATLVDGKAIRKNSRAKQFCTYIIFNDIDEMFYIGYTGNFIERSKNHFSKKKRDYILKDQNSYLYHVMNKYGNEHFTMISVNMFDDELSAGDDEEYLIAYYKKLGYKLYNISKGNIGGPQGEYIWVNPYNTETEKRCSNCEEIKPNIKFSKDKTKFWGYDNRCKDCKNKITNTRRHGENYELTLVSKPGYSLNDENNKWCNSCEKLKLREDFYKNEDYGDGLCYICKNCCAERNKKDISELILVGRRLNTEKEKYCPNCKKMLPKTNDYFYLSKSRGFVSYCKPRSKEKKKKVIK